MAEAKVTDVKVIPGMDRLKMAGGGLLAGILGGIAVSVGATLLGPRIGPLLGGALGGAIIGGDGGRIVVVNAAMDTTILTIAGMRSE